MPVKFIRVRDLGTKHEFDVPSTDRRIAAGLLRPIKSDRYPPADRPRRAKHHNPLTPAGRRRGPDQTRSKADD
jgi:hypothetical protein